MNDILRRAIEVGCAYDIYIEFLIESAFTLAESGRPIRGYCAYAVPALRIIKSIGYSGYKREGTDCADKLFAQVQNLFDQKTSDGPDQDGLNWDETVNAAITAQQRVEDLFGNQSMRSRSTAGSSDGPYDTATIAEGTPVFGFLLPQVQDDIAAQAGKPEKLH